MIRKKSKLSLFSTLKDAVSGVRFRLRGYFASASPMAGGRNDAIVEKTVYAPWVPDETKAPFEKESILIERDTCALLHRCPFLCF